MQLTEDEKQLLIEALKCKGNEVFIQYSTTTNIHLKDTQYKELETIEKLINKIEREN